MPPAPKTATQEKPATPNASVPETAAPAKPVMESVNRITAKLMKTQAVGIANAIRVAGIIRSVKNKALPSDPSETYVAFGGDFRMRVGNKILASDELSLPLAAESVLVLAHGKSGDNATAFCLSMHREEDKTQPRGFKFVCSEVRPSATLTLDNDPVAKLLD